MAVDQKLPSHILLRSVDHAEALSQARLRQRGDAHPFRWQSFLHEVSIGGVSTVTFPGCNQNGVFMAWGPSREALLAALFRRRLAYLAWGVAHFSGWRQKLVRFLLSRATLILVNDEVTAQEVAQLTERRPRLIPYLVDTDFYQRVPLDERKDYLFCPGSNDRDADLLVQLALQGETVIWLNNDVEQSARYQHASPRLRIVSRPSYAELRSLYQQARACILPLSQDIHLWR